MTQKPRKYAAIVRRACLLAVSLSITCLSVAGSAAGTATGGSAPLNIALNKPACSSSIENDEHNAAQANDGDPETCWRADDEPEGGAEWWQVDLQQPFSLCGCEITWPYDGKNYRCKVEGSADSKTWIVLSDQTGSVSKSRIQNLKFESAGQIRYVKVIVTGFEEGCWASIGEVKVFGTP